MGRKEKEVQSSTLPKAKITSKMRPNNDHYANTQVRELVCNEFFWISSELTRSTYRSGACNVCIARTSRTQLWRIYPPTARVYPVCDLAEARAKSRELPISLWGEFRPFCLNRRVRSDADAQSQTLKRPPSGTAARGWRASRGKDREIPYLFGPILQAIMNSSSEDEGYWSYDYIIMNTLLC